MTPENYFKEIAFARTFGFFSEVEQLRKSNLIRGGSLENAVVLSDFEHPLIQRQKLELEVTPENYFKEIAFARTFGFFSEVEQLRKSNLIRGGSLENAVVLSEDGILNGTLRASDEFVRHKALDLIGDIALCGHPLIGRIHAHKAGHALHTRLASCLTLHNSHCELVEESALAATRVPILL